MGKEKKDVFGRGLQVSVDSNPIYGLPSKEIKVNTDISGRELHVSIDSNPRYGLQLRIVDLEEGFDVGVGVNINDLLLAIKIATRGDNIKLISKKVKAHIDK